MVHTHTHTHTYGHTAAQHVDIHANIVNPFPMYNYHPKISNIAAELVQLVEFDLFKMATVPASPFHLPSLKLL